MPHYRGSLRNKLSQDSKKDDIIITRYTIIRYAGFTLKAKHKPMECIHYLFYSDKFYSFY